MSVRLLNGRFTGLRVQRKIGATTRIQHFSYKTPVKGSAVAAWRDSTAAEKKVMLKKAEALDKVWEAEQLAAKTPKVFDPFDGAATNTGCKGIAYRWKVDGQGYDVEAFCVNVVGLDKKQKSESVRLKSRTWREGWEIAVHKLADIKQVDTTTLKRMLNRMPRESILRTNK